MRVLRLFSLIGIAIFVYILMSVDLGMVFSILSGIDPVILGVAFVSIFPILVIKVFKWEVLLRTYGVRYPFRGLFRAWLMGFSISLVTPARIGDFSRAYYVRGETSIGKALTTVIIDRTIDVFMLFVLAIIGMLSLFASYLGYLDMMSVLILFVAFLAGVYFLTKERFMKFIFEKAFYRIVPDSRKTKVKFTFDEFYRGMERIKSNRKSVFLAVALAVPAWLFSVFQVYLLAASMGVDISYFFLLSIMPIVSLLEILPISFSGIGTRDAALIFFLSFISLSGYAIPLSLLILLFAYVVPGLAGSLLIVTGGRVRPAEF